MHSSTAVKPLCHLRYRVRTYDEDLPAGRQRLLVLFADKWPNGTTLSYFFLESNATRQQQVTEAFKLWEEVGMGMRFTRADNAQDAQIRIAFRDSEGSWSYLGTQILEIATSNPTMNIGWDDPTLDTATHEIGHTLGFPHEHQNPLSGIKWDEEAVYRYFGGYPNYWSRAVTYHNVLRKLDIATVEGSEWDRNSIMHYAFVEGLILDPKKYRTEPLIPDRGLSSMDKAMVRQFYPLIQYDGGNGGGGGDDGGNDGDDKTLQPWISKKVTMKPGNTKMFTFSPETSCQFVVQTFGETDTFLMLIDGDGHVIDHDDDSGLGRNARISRHLMQGVRYTIRLLLVWASEGDCVGLVAFPK